MTTIGSTSDDVCVAEIAAGLTDAQRGACIGRIIHIMKRDPLVALGILTNDGGRNWTPVGLAVRAHLLNTRTNNDG